MALAVFLKAAASMAEVESGSPPPASAISLRRRDISSCFVLAGDGMAAVAGSPGGEITFF